MNRKRPDLSASLADLYASVADASRFGVFMRGLCDATGCHIATFQHHDFSAMKVSLLEVTGVGAEEFISRESVYANDNVWIAPSAPLICEGGVFDGDDFVAHADLIRSHYYQGFLGQIDIDHSIGICAAFDHEHAAFLTMNRCRRAGRFDEESKGLYRRLAPHLVNVLRLRSQLETLHDTVTTLQVALDRVPLGVFFVDCHGRVIRMNHGAERMLARSSGGIALSRQKLVARSATDTHKLESAIAGAIGARATHEGGTPGACRLTMLGIKGLPCAMLRIHPLPAGPALEAGKARAVVILREVASGSSHDLQEAVMLAFDLTVAEARLVVELYARGHLADAATSLSITLATARSRLEVVFDKTGTHGQPALMRVVAEMGAMLG